jgi:putative sigma-54 modulation protein
MQITVSGHQMEITGSLREYVAEKIGRLQKHIDKAISTTVVLHVQKNLHRAEATVNTRGATLHANVEGDDMYAAIDTLADKLGRQIGKRKQKLGSRHRSARSIKKPEVL